MIYADYNANAPVDLKDRPGADEAEILGITTESIRWNESMSVGVAALDSEHKMLIDILNDLHSRVEAGHGGEVMRVVLTRLTDYVHTHCRHEEALLALYGYDQAETQQAAHVEFGNKVMDLQLMLLKGDKTVGQETVIFLRDWLIHHILTSDMDYKACLAGHDLK
jgi:hemerythrin-like metal-binding protein